MRPKDHRKVNIPTRVSDYKQLLRKAWRPDWPYSKTDISQMSLASLRQIYRELGKLNFLKLGGSNGAKFLEGRKAED